MEQYSNLINQCAESHRRVFPVINTCLENVTAASAAIDPKLVRRRGGGGEGEGEGEGEGGSRRVDGI